MADSSKSSKSKSEALADGNRRLRVTYSPDGFRGVKDVDAELAAIMVAEGRAVYVDDSTELGEEEPPAGEFRGPLRATADTSSGGAEGSSTAASTASTAASASSTR